MFGNVLLWPFRTLGRVLSLLVSAVVSLVLLPVKSAQYVIRSVWNRFNKTLLWIEPKIDYLRSKKPLVYIFPLSPKAAKSVDISSIPSTPPILGVTHGRDKRDLASRSALRRRPPSSASSRAKSKCEDEDTPPSMNSLIQDLVEFSKQHHSPPVMSVSSQPPPPPPPPPASLQSSSTTSCAEEETEKIKKLIKDLQEVASVKTTSGLHKPLPPEKEETKRQQQQQQENDPELVQLLSDLNTLESYVTHFLDEQGESHTEGGEEENAMLSGGSLETITEEETSKECSPSYVGSPGPSRTDMLLEGVQNDQKKKEEETKFLHKVAGSEEMQRILAQYQEVVNDETDGGPSDGQRRDSSLELASPAQSVNKQFVETEKEFQTVIDALEHQHKFIETQQELQEMMNSLDPDSIMTTPSTSSKQSSSQRPTSLFPSPQDQQQLLYDSLGPQHPVYSVPNKRKDVTSSPRQQDQSPPPQPPPDNEEQIYDSLMNVTDEIREETPPPIPAKRTGSDGYMSTGSVDHSPRGERSRERKRHSSSSEERRSLRRNEGRHRSRKHRRHSSRRSECNCCCYDDQSPERCGHHHHHRPRSRERHHNHHHRPRSISDESTSTRRMPRESSGYESQELDSPSQLRRVLRSNSAASTPKETRRSFLGGLFSRKSTTSLTSVSSRMSDAGGDGGSVYSYKL